MQIILKLLVTVGLVVGLGMGPGWAQNFDKGLEAYHSGDFATSLREWKPLAEQGVVGAQYGLGLLYGLGKGGVPRDYAEAVKWHRKAAEQGHASAQTILGITSFKGQGVIQDNVVAHMWLNLAAAQGYENGATVRDIVAKRMTPAAIEEAQRLARECLARNYKNCGR